ncbi:NTE family protein [Hydrogenispora ethanolica]|uniref:NTE family protein n=1 Tax=Hydrogenispora ethanolica TaxID=1082276 RepID=A0A4R1RSS0_HYDET|nr:patatin-like phospholipase family protein [Hydrogenispora ethanolica]TCL69379.1 NTE family protein [Hydrogenispora ethanolica]
MFYEWKGCSLKPLRQKLLILLCAVLLWQWSGGKAMAAAPTELSRPRIGLALGGGSALGFSHIGVLQWLEEHHIPVDAVAGTSMGGLMGGLYALGMSPAEIEVFVKALDWNHIFDSSPPYNALDFRRKEDRLEYPIQEIGFRHKLIIPNGLSLYRVSLLLSRITLPYSGIASFDELPTPYRSVATDIRNSEPYVLKDGSLAEAMRATMAIPGVFTPVEREGRLLVDGGLVNNVPADVVKTMGADAVIAVDCNDNNRGRDIRGIDSVLMGSLNTVIIENTRRSLEAADVVIHPEFQNVSFMDWNKIDEFVSAGYQAAASQASALQKYALSESEWQIYQQQRAGRQRTLAAVPEAVMVKGTNELNRKAIQSQLRPFLGKPLQLDALDKVLIEISGCGLYESIRYELAFEETGTVLLITAVEKNYGPPFISFALRGTYDGSNYTALNAGFRTTAYHILGDHSELRLDFGVGSTPYLSGELYKPFANSSWFLAPNLSLEQTDGSLFSAGQWVRGYELTSGHAGVDLGYTLNKFAEVRLGYSLGFQRPETGVASDLDDLDGSVRKTELRYTFSQADEEARRSFLGTLTGSWYDKAPGAQGGFGTAETRIRWSYPVGSRDLIVGTLAAGLSFQGDLPLIQQFKLGGPLQLGSYPFQALQGDNYGLGTIGYLKYLRKLPLTRKNLYLGAFFQRGGVFEKWSAPDLSSDVSFGLVSPTVFGTLYIGTSFGKEDKGRFNFILGNLF